MKAFEMCVADSVIWGVQVAHRFNTYCCVSARSPGRSNENPMGRTDVKKVAEANEMVARSIVLMLIGVAKLAGWMLEQPRGSLLGKHTRKDLRQPMITDRPCFVGRPEVVGQVCKRNGVAFCTL